MTVEEVAQKAWTRANSKFKAAGREQLGQNDLERARDLVSDAYSFINIYSGYDPKAWAIDIGDQAAIEWVKSTLLGTDPLSSSEFVRLYNTYRARAASESKRQEWDDLRAEEENA